MAELIIKRIDAKHNDPGKNERACFKRGDIIDILVDGLAETMPHLTVIKIPGLPKESISFLKSPAYKNEGTEDKETLIRRKWKIPPGIMNTLFPKAVTTATIKLKDWAVFKNKIVEKTPVYNV